MKTATAPDLVCFSHLRWGFVYQRPQHLMSRFAVHRRVFFVEEPVLDPQGPHLKIDNTPEGVTVVVPHLPAGTREEGWRTEGELLTRLFAREEVSNFVAWYYTPMAWPHTAFLRPRLVVYDCMDQLSAFAGAPPEMEARERELMESADVVLTGGRSLYEDKRHRHDNVHLFPSSVDAAHFRRARTVNAPSHDQASIPWPRLGYAGVIDERLDLPLLAAVAAARPDWSLVMIGPVAKIDPASLPAGANLHYLGMKSYQELPTYLGAWDVGLLPFARNEATRFISPTKTPEYLAAGLPVVSTSIADVVRPYGTSGLVAIADEPQAFVTAAEAALVTDRALHRARADAFLADLSWDETAARMTGVLAQAWEEAGGAREPEVA